MKKCPYCAEEIQDEAIKCRYCGSDLLAPRPGQPSAGPSGPPSAPEREPGWPPPADPSTAPGPSPAPPTAPGPSPAPPGTQAPAFPPSGQEPNRPAATAPGPRVGEGALRFSHSGERFVLGYGTDFFGIWDRSAPGGPVARFARSDEGWDAAWNRFSAWEPRHVVVPQMGTPPDVRVSTAPFRSAHLRAQWVVALLALAAVAAAITVVSLVMELDLLQRAREGSPPSIGEAEANDNRVNAINGISVVVFFAAGIVFLLWQYRAHANLPALGSAGMRFTPGWVVAWWLIPIANVAMPYLTVRELHKASDPDAGAIDWKDRPTSPLVGLWWASWLLRLGLSGAALAFAGPEDASLDELITADYLGVASETVTIVAAILLIVLVRRIDRRQQQKGSRVAGFAAASSPAW